MKTCKTTFFIILVLVLSQSVLSQQLVSVSATQLQPGKQAGYTFVIETEQDLSANAVVRIDFPSEFLLDNVKMAASSSFTGGLDVVVDNNTVELQRKGLGEVAPAGQLDFYVAAVNNPNDMEQDYQFNVTILDNDQELANGTFQTRIQQQENSNQ